ncbi:MAG: hypothetical protein Q7R96_04110 [Nanoarchaeota archaeon]|nr:hypothetical protein [Nanoarchaeota archaeon]
MATTEDIMKEGYKLGIVINKEKLSNGKAIYVAHCDTLNVTSQGYTLEEAKKNITEAVTIELEECPEKKNHLLPTNKPTFAIIEVTPHGKTPTTLRTTAR